MSFGLILYQLFLSPLTLVFEAVYSVAYGFLQSAGAAIFPLSLVVNFLLLPFYNRADAIQEEERKRQDKMAPFVKHIKNTFKGDERYMMLQALYREHGYKPVYALRSSIALILEVPFFIAAYRFLSDLPVLRGTSFLFLKDLGQPDALFVIGGFTVNLLPILMTLINIVSSEIYTKGLKFKDKITLHGMALIFLVLLYNSPSGLVLYWTLNNIFSLAKNIVHTSSDKKRSLRNVCAVTGVLICAYSLFFKGPMRSRLLIVLVGILFLFPLLIRSRKESKKIEKSETSDAKLFILGALFLSFFLGALIPSYVILSSPAEFIVLTSVHSPVRYIIYSLLTALGAFVVWGGLFYYLAKERSKKIATTVLWCFSAVSSVNFLLFGKSESILSSDLRYDAGFSVYPKDLFLNLAIVCGTIALICFICKKKDVILRFLAPIVLAASVLLSGYNTYKINSYMPAIRRAAARTTMSYPKVELSKTGKNVVVIMLDRAVSSYIPYIFNEAPNLKEQFSGFTWYPNTLSYGLLTVVASPALFGGYDYTPSAINARSDLTLQQKHNEALLTMPLIFSDSGYDVTVFDPPYANYSAIPDLSIYDPYPSVKAYNTEYGLFLDESVSEDMLTSTWKRNFFCYGLMKASPLFLQPLIYTDGNYFKPDETQSIMQKDGDDSAHFVISPAYMNAFSISYNSLKALPDMTMASDTTNNTFFLIQNGTSHNVMPLQEPGYEPEYEVDNTEFDRMHTDRFTLNGESITVENQTQLSHYQCNMAAWLQVGNWMDYLKEIGVYDNTRIIIVSDHGFPLGSIDDMFFLDGSSVNAAYNSEDAMAYNPVLFVKDFGAEGEYTTDYSFMTNADTPYLAMEGLINNAQNPFTGNPIYRPDIKNADKQYIMYTDSWSLDKDGTTIDPEGTVIWYSLKGEDLFNMENWQEEERGN